jgi:lysophospholipase L1-like esterase
MARLAQEVGVPRRVIHLETGSRTTRENGELSSHLLRWLGASRLLIVTDKLHMPRASGVFGQLGFAVERASVPIFEGHPDNVSMLTAGFREMLALWYYRMRGWVAAPSPSGRPASAESTTNGQPIMQSDGPVVILGASYAGGWDIARIGQVPVSNLGIAGQQSFEMLERFERDVVSKQPRAVILWGFINDIFRSPADSMDATLTRVRDSYLQMVSLARRNGIVPIIATEVTVRSPDSWRNTLASWVGWLRGKQGYQDRINRHVQSVNRWLVDLARQENLLLLDLQSTLAEQGGARRKEYTQEDGSHISRVGYTAITEYAEPILTEYLERP